LKTIQIKKKKIINIHGLLRVTYTLMSMLLKIYKHSLTNYYYYQKYKRVMKRAGKVDMIKFDYVTKNIS